MAPHGQGPGRHGVRRAELGESCYQPERCGFESCNSFCGCSPTSSVWKQAWVPLSGHRTLFLQGLSGGKGEQLHGPGGPMLRSTGMVIPAQLSKGGLAHHLSFLTGMSLSSLDVFKAGRRLGHPQRGSLNRCPWEGLFPPASLHLRTAAASHDLQKNPLCRPIRDRSSVTEACPVCSGLHNLCFRPPPRPPPRAGRSTDPHVGGVVGPS